MDNHQTKHHSTYFNLRVTTTIKRTVMIGIQFHCYFCITICWTDTVKECKWDKMGLWCKNKNSSVPVNLTLLGRDNHDIKMHQANDDVAYKGLMRYRFTCKKYMALHKNIYRGTCCKWKVQYRVFRKLPQFATVCGVLCTEWSTGWLISARLVRQCGSCSAAVFPSFTPDRSAASIGHAQHFHHFHYTHNT